MNVGSNDLIGEGREAICVALGSRAEAEQDEGRVKLAGLLLELAAEIEAGAMPPDMPPGRANYIFRTTDDYWRRRWDAISADPRAKHRAHLEGIGTMYWARRVAFEWRFPGKWTLGRTV